MELVRVRPGRRSEPGDLQRPVPLRELQNGAVGLGRLGPRAAVRTRLGGVPEASYAAT